MAVLPGVLDLHAHYLPSVYAEALAAHGVDRPDGMPAVPSWSVESALALMDEVGIAAQVLSISSPGLDFLPAAERPALAAAVNDVGLAIVAAAPSRFGVLATLPLPDVEASLRELDRVHGVDGVALHTQTEGTYLGDPSLDPLMAALDARGSLVTIHPVSPCGWEAVSFGRPRPMLEFLFDTTRAVVNMLLSGVFDRFPAIRWVVPHAGAVLPVVADRVALFNGVDAVSALGRLRYDLAGTPVPRALQAVRTIVDDSHLVYGSDFPFTPGPAVAGLAGVLADAVEGGRLRANALELLPRFA